MNLTEKNANFYYSKKILKRTASRIFLERNLTLMPRLRKYCGSNLVLFLSFPANKCKVLAGKRYHSLKKSYQTPERTTRKVTQRILIQIFVLQNGVTLENLLNSLFRKNTSLKLARNDLFETSYLGLNYLALFIIATLTWRKENGDKQKTQKRMFHFVLLDENR